MDWTQLKLFKGIDLNDSFILNWEQNSNKLIFEIEASIWPESEHYIQPKKDEYTCYRKAILEFRGINKVCGLVPIESVQSTTDLDGSTDYGNIESLKLVNGNFELSGEFGSVTIFGGELCFEVHT